MNQNTKNNNISLDSMWNKIQFFKMVSGFLAAPVSIFFHRRIGYRELSPRWTFVVAVGMCVAAVLCPALAGPTPACVYVYAVVMACLCWFQRMRRWEEFTTNMRWHTRSIGITWLAGLPLPPVLRSWMRTERYLEPALAMLAGLIIFGLLSRLLGLIVCFSAFSMFVYHEETFKRELNILFDRIDSLIEAEREITIANLAKTGKDAEECQQLLEGTGLPIPSGADFTIRQLIARRLAELDEAA